MVRVCLVIAVLLAGLGCAQTQIPTAPGDVPSPSAPTPALPAPAPTPPSLAAPESARYVVVFKSSWSPATHPTDFPESAHYSGLIGGTHSGATSFWSQGSLATEGIRRMAERGSKTPLDGEVGGAIAAGTAQYLLSGPALAQSPGSARLEFDITQTFPMVTLVTMVAPSPDWFVGVSGLELFQNGQWIQERRIDLHAYDAGTDSGRTYTSADERTSPPQLIQPLGYPLNVSGAGLPLGTFTFTRLN